MSLSEQQLRPYIRRFEDIREYCKNNNIKEAKKIIAEQEKKKTQPNNLPFVELYKGAFALGQKNVEEALAYCEKIEEKKPNDALFLESFIKLYRSTGAEEECVPIYKRLVALCQKNVEALTQAIICMLISGYFNDAQETSMQLTRLAQVETSFLICATCCYFRALHEKPQFYAFAAKFFEKAQPKQYDAIYMYVESMIKSNQAEKALAYVQSADVQKILSYDKMGLIRLEISCLQALGKTEEIGKLAEKFLRTINAESIDEWRLVVEHHPNALQVIQDLNKGKRRGPKLAEIDYQIKNGSDASDLIIDYANSRQNVGYLFGDLRKYVNDQNRQKLSAINDQALHEYITGEFIGEVTNSRSAVIKAEHLLKEYSKTNDRKYLVEAGSTCALFDEAPECRLMLIRLATFFGATSFIGENQTKLKLEAIQFLSLGHVFAEGIINQLDIDEMKRISNLTEQFCFNSITGFNQFYQRCIDDRHFITLLQATNIRKEIMQHRIRYLYKVVDLWTSILENEKPEIVKNKMRVLTQTKSIEELVNKTDETALPLYTDVQKLIYPDTLDLVKGVSLLTQIILAENADEKLVNDITVLYKDFADFVKEGKVSEESSLFSLASMMMFAKKHQKNVDQIIAVVDKYNERKLKEIDELPSPFNKTVEEQKKRLEKAINTIKAFK